MKYFTLSIQGMHCRSCELTLEDHLRGVQGVKSVRVQQKNNCAAIGYTADQPDHEALERAVTNAGYRVGEPQQEPWLTRNARDYRDLGLGALALLALYFLARGSGLLKLSIASSAMSLPFAVVIGLVAGVSTCMAMVGGLILGLSTRHNEQHPEATPWQKFRPHLFLNAGRVSGYAVLGGLLGAIGGFLRLSNVMLALLTLAVGIVMILLGTKLTGISPRLSKTSITLPSSIGRFLGLSRHNKEYSHKAAFITGALTFFLPCGFTQAMQLYAIGTGSFTRGALAMGLFAVGTAPALLSIGGLTSVLKGSRAKKFSMAAGIAVLVFGILNIRNGLTLTGISSHGATAKSQATASDAITYNVQTVRMDQLAGGYSPNAFTVQKGVPVKWIITSKTTYSCASTIVMPTLNITKDLRLGENEIDFTPTEIGKINFSCSMGMYRGTFTVVDRLTVKQDPSEKAASILPPTAALRPS
ncbi:MAG: sulfite exporter TauE/SafE family protein [bacterium]